MRILHTKVYSQTHLSNLTVFMIWLENEEENSKESWELGELLMAQHCPRVCNDEAASGGLGSSGLILRIFSNLNDSMILLAIPIRLVNIHLEGICSVRGKNKGYDIIILHAQWKVQKYIKPISVRAFYGSTGEKSKENALV